MAAFLPLCCVGKKLGGQLQLGQPGSQVEVTQTQIILTGVLGLYFITCITQMQGKVRRSKVIPLRICVYQQQQS